MNINKELLLEFSDRGLDFYKYVLGKLIPEDSRRMRNVKNPFYQDKKPSLSIYLKNDQWLFHDFGEPEFSGDVFQLAAFYYELDCKENFNQILYNMTKDLQINFEFVGIESNENLQGFESGIGYQFTPSIAEGIAAATSYFKQYGVNERILREYRVSSIEKYATEGKMKSIKSGGLKIAYHADRFVKLYSPQPKKFWYVGKKSPQYIYGWREIVKRVTKAVRTGAGNLQDILIITGGEKDVLTFSALGYDAISLNSETATFPQDFAMDLKQQYGKIVVVYDTDETGIRNGTALAAKHDFQCYKLPDQLMEEGGKDISDYVKLGLPLEVVREGIKLSMPVAATDSITSTSIAPEIHTKTPVFPKKLYTSLPNFFQNLVSHFPEGRDQDLMLLSSLTVLSTCFPKVEGVYDNSRVGTNLFMFVTAPAASGKGKAKFAFDLINGVKRCLKEKYQKKYAQHQIELAEYEANRNDDYTLLRPVEPKEQYINIPANISSAKLVETLCINENFGLIFETEADTLRVALKNEWGNFSDCLRKAFHHELISLDRKGGGRSEIDRTYLSVFLTGTPKQSELLLEGVENGFFSRFLFYDFEQPISWKDTFADQVDLGAVFSDYATTVRDWWERLEKLKAPIIIKLNSTQQQAFTTFFTNTLSDSIAENGSDIAGSIVRMGLCYFRICMILTIVRNLEDDYLPSQIEVSDTDFHAALIIMKTLSLHLKEIFTRLKATSTKVDVIKPQPRRLYDALPDEFNRKLYNETASKLEINNGTAEKYLTTYKENRLLESSKHGFYRKIKTKG